jgi:hypothetical protein
MNQKVLLKIVLTWDLNENPEYRGFRCANCQKYMHKAYYHWLTDGGYKTPVHFCKECERKFVSSNIVVTKPRTVVDRLKFGLKFPENIWQKIRKAVKSWDTKAKPKYKTFTCDDCGRKMHKAYHVWSNMDGTLVETHFCKECANRMGLQNLRNE